MTNGLIRLLLNRRKTTEAREENGKRKLSHNLWVPALFFVVTAIFLHPIFLGKVFFPGDLLYKMPPWFHSGSSLLKDVMPVNNPLLWDPVTAFYPWYTFLGRAISEGFFPLWNNMVMTGTPFLANWQSGVLALENAVFYIFETATALNIHIFLKTFLALFFTYLFLRKLKLSLQASVFGAITYGFSAFFIVWLSWPQTRVAIWLPLILFTVEYLLENPSLRRSSFVSLAIAAAVFAGHPGTLIQVFMIVFVYVIFRTIAQPENRARKISYLAASLALGLGIASILILPGYELLKSSYQYSLRGETDYLQLGINYEYLTLLFFPYYFGHHKDSLYLGISNFNEISSYVGLLPLFFSFWAIVFLSKLRRIWPIIALFLFALIMVFGFWPQSLLYKLPLVAMQPTQRYIFMLTFALTVLGAFGFDAFFKKDKNEKGIYALAIIFFVTMFLIFLNVDERVSLLYRGLFFFGFVSFVVAIGAYIRINHKQVKWLIVLVLFVDLFIFGFKLNSYIDKKLVYPQTPVTNFLKNKQKKGEPFRVLSVADSAMPNSLMAYGIDDLRGRDALIINRTSNHFDLLTDKDVQPQQPNFILPNILRTDQIDFLNVRYVISEMPIGNNLPKSFIKSNGLLDLRQGAQGQDFIAKSANLSGVSLLLGTTKGSLNPHFFRFKLYDENGKVVREGMRLAKYAKDHKYYHFIFRPIKKSKNKKYTFVIESSKTDKKNKIVVFINTGDEYLEGTRHLNNEQQKGDLVFYPHYYRPIPKFESVLRDKNMTIYENKNVFQRVFAVKEPIIIPNEKKAFDYLKNSDIDLAEQVVLNKKPKYEGIETEYDGTESIEVVDYEPNKVSVKVKLPTRKIIVLSDNYYNGWKASIDGKEASLYLANSSFRAIAVNKGEHRLQMIYKPDSFRRGSMISLASILLVFAFMIAPSSPRRESAK